MPRSPAGLGRRNDLDTELLALGATDLTAGRVLAQYPEQWLVATADGKPKLVHARGRLRHENTGTPVTGDWVALDAGGAITAVLERHGTVVRRAVGPGGGGQVLAANVDLALVTESLPEPNLARAERLATLASAGGVPASLVLTKADLDPDAVTPLTDASGLIGAMSISASTGAGLEALRAMLEPGTTAVLLGPSGAGKSTLVNALLGDPDRQATGTVRDDGRGRHTTVTRELLALPHGALLIDTPGIREVGLWDGTGDAFADVEAAAAGCRFSNCRHGTEPGCQVVATIDPQRLAAWRELTAEQTVVDDRRSTSQTREQLLRAQTRQQRADRRRKDEE